MNYKKKEKNKKSKNKKKNISLLVSKVLEDKEYLFLNNNENKYSIFPISFYSFNSKNSSSKQIFAIDCLLKKLQVNKELEKNKKRILLITSMFKTDNLNLKQEVKEKIKNKYYFPYVFDEGEINIS